jgi:hypothetical protein
LLIWVNYIHNTQFLLGFNLVTLTLKKSSRYPTISSVSPKKYAVFYLKENALFNLLFQAVEPFTENHGEKEYNYKYDKNNFCYPGCRTGNIGKPKNGGYNSNN